MRSLTVSKLVISGAWIAAVGCSSTSADPGNSGGGGGTSPGAGGAGGAGSASVTASAGTASSSGTGVGGGGGSAPTGFVHPGVLVNKGMLEFVKGKITQEPWKSALAKAQADSHGKTSYKPTKTVNVICFPSSGAGSVGCNEEKSDADAAYTHALLWYYTGNKANADKAMEIMDLYSSTTKEHSEDNAQLQSAWVASTFTRAAEIMRYSNAGWPDDKAARFGDMLSNAYMPYIKDFSTRTGNWDASTIEAVMAIAVYNDDMATFQRAVARWRLRVPAWAYLKSVDGAKPAQPPEKTLSDSALKGYWINPTKYVDGLGQETCKDQPGDGTGGMGHEQYGLAALINAAETARIQGVDLFKEEQTRLVATLEFHAKYLDKSASPDGLCENGINGLTIDPMWEIAYNAYANVLGQALPETLKVVTSKRPSGLDHHMVWETLTHGDIGAAGL